MPHVEAASGALSQLLSANCSIGPNKATANSLQSVIERAIPGVAMMDSDGVMTYCNKSWRRLLGYESETEELIGQHASVCWNERTESALSVDSFAGGLDEDWHAEAMLRAIDGSLIDVSISLLPLTDEAGEVVSLAAVATSFARLFDPSHMSESGGPSEPALAAFGLHASSARTIRELHGRTSKVEKRGAMKRAA
jgi:PAS domain S-box-containing protein